MRKLLYLVVLVSLSVSSQSMQKIENTSIQFLPIQHATFILKTDTLVL